MELSDAAVNSGALRAHGGACTLVPPEGFVGTPSGGSGSSVRISGGGVSNTGDIDVLDGAALGAL